MNVITGIDHLLILHDRVILNWNVTLMHVSKRKKLKHFVLLLLITPVVESLVRHLGIRHLD
jgi:hypothetical protein